MGPLVPRFEEADYIHKVEYVKRSEAANPGETFLKQRFNEKKRGWFPDNAIAEVDGLIFRARQRLRSRYHCSVTLAPSPGFLATSSGPRMQSWHLYLTPEALSGGIKLASTLGYTLTLSTVRAGASERSFHFLAMPRLLRFGGESYPLYQWLEHRPVIRLFESTQLTVDFVIYAAFCIHVYGSSRRVAPLVWRLAESYADLTSFNLVIVPGADIQDIKDIGDPDSSVFFFPRPRRPTWEGPKDYADKDPPWSFGAFEMGGFFVQGDEGIYAELTYSKLCKFLHEVSIFECREELHCLTGLLGDLTQTKDIEGKIDKYREEVGNSMLE